MPALFYDLETSDKNLIGQILNYCFVLVGDDFSIQDELCGDIHISRLQLPHPDAIRANRIDVLNHQQATTAPEFHECHVMRKIAEFISSCTEQTQDKVVLIGFNSSRFDLPYLRTSFIRNGINPYFGGKLSYRDVLTTARKICVSHPNFPHAHLFRASTDEETRLSLRLETLAQHFGLLSGVQSHHSRDDVYLTIQLTALLRDRFGLNAILHDCYEPPARLPRGALRTQVLPSYDDALSGPSVSVPMALLDDDYRYSLWIDLRRYGEGEGRESIQWFNKAVSAFFVGPDPEPEYQDLASRACEEFKDIRLSNYFQESSCDIEQDIYRLDMRQIDALGEAIWKGNTTGLGDAKNSEPWRLYIRHLLREYQWESYLGSAGKDISDKDRRMRDLLGKYALHRYGGKLRLDKGGKDPGAFHATYGDLMARIDVLMQDSSADHALMKSLRKFYQESEIACLLEGVGSIPSRE